MDVRGCVNPDKLMNVPIEVCLQVMMLDCPPTNNSGMQGIAAQQYKASMQTVQDRQQNKQPFTAGQLNKSISTQIVLSS